MLIAKLPVDEQNLFVVQHPLQSYFDQRVSSMNVCFNGTARTKIYVPRWKHILTIHIIKASREQQLFHAQIDKIWKQLTLGDLLNSLKNLEGEATPMVEETSFVLGVSGRQNVGPSKDCCGLSDRDT
jgi:hypothetical protein